MDKLYRVPPLVFMDSKQVAGRRIAHSVFGTIIIDANHAFSGVQLYSGETIARTAKDGERVANEWYLSRLLPALEEVK